MGVTSTTSVMAANWSICTSSDAYILHSILQSKFRAIFVPFRGEKCDFLQVFVPRVLIFKKLHLYPSPKRGSLHREYGGVINSLDGHQKMVLAHNTVICVLRQLNIDNCNLIEDCEPEEFFTKEGKCLNKTKDNLTL